MGDLTIKILLAEKSASETSLLATLLRGCRQPKYDIQIVFGFDDMTSTFDARATSWHALFFVPRSQNDVIEISDYLATSAPHLPAVLIGGENQTKSFEIPPHPAYSVIRRQIHPKNVHELVKVALEEQACRLEAYYERNALADLTKSFPECANQFAWIQVPSENIKLFDPKLVAENDRLLKELKRSNRDLRQFAYAASHDLKEPLRVIINFAEMLKEEYPVGRYLDQNSIQYIDLIVEASKRQRALIENLLDFSKIESHGDNLTTCDLNRILEETKLNLSVGLREKKAKIEADDLPHVLGDHDQLVRLFQNLIANGIKFQPKNSTPTIKISCKKCPSHLELCIQDNGIGFEEEFKERMFEIFQRLHSREEYPGTGIGLAICRRIIERHHGRIWAESKQGSGSRFYFTLMPAEEERDAHV